MPTYKLEVDGLKVEFEADGNGLVDTLNALQNRQNKSESTPKNKAPSIPSKANTPKTKAVHSTSANDGSLRDQLRILIKEGFFNDFKTSSEVKDRLAIMGCNQELTSISSRLGNMYKPKYKTTQPELVRKTIGKNKFAYKAIVNDANKNPSQPPQLKLPNE